MISGMNERGSTLIEVLIAILVVAIGLIGMGGMLGYSLKGNQSSYLRTQASIMAADLSEALRVQRQDALDDSLSISDGDVHCSGTYEDSTNPNTLCGYMSDWLERVKRYLPDGTATLAIAKTTPSGEQENKTAVITVSWTDSRGAVTDADGNISQNATASGKTAPVNLTDSQSFQFEFEL